MAHLEYYPLGTNPEAEAIRTRKLYFNHGVDNFVRDEFEATVNAYTSLPLRQIALRLRDRYTGDQPQAYGVLPVYNGEDIGMAIWGEKEFLDSRRTSRESSGINVSAWLLKQARGQGFGKQVLLYATEMALILANESDKPVWTSIKPENLASRQSCEDAGFVEVGPQPEKPERLLYIHHSSQPS